MKHVASIKQTKNCSSPKSKDAVMEAVRQFSMGNAGIRVSVSHNPSLHVVAITLLERDMATGQDHEVNIALDEKDIATTEYQEMFLRVQSVLTEGKTQIRSFVTPCRAIADIHERTPAVNAAKTPVGKYEDIAHQLTEQVMTKTMPNYLIDTAAVIYRRPDTRFIPNIVSGGHTEDIYCDGMIPIYRPDNPGVPYYMGPWNTIKDDRVLGVFNNSTDRGAEGDVFMGEAISRILTPEFRVSFPKVFKAEAFQEGQEPKYSIVMLFPKKMSPVMQKLFDQMKALAAATAKAKWGDKMPKNLRSPFRDGSEKDLPGYEDVIFVSASSKIKPGLVNENAEPLLGPEEFYPGCYAHAYVTCFAYDMAGNRGVSFGVSTIQKIKDGTPFVPRNNAQDDFAPLAPGQKSATSTDASSGDIDFVFGQ